MDHHTKGGGGPNYRTVWTTHCHIASTQLTSTLREGRSSPSSGLESGIRTHEYESAQAELALWVRQVGSYSLGLGSNPVGVGVVSLTPWGHLVTRPAAFISLNSASRWLSHSEKFMPGVPTSRYSPYMIPSTQKSPSPHGQSDSLTRVGRLCVSCTCGMSRSWVAGWAVWHGCGWAGWDQAPASCNSSSPVLLLGLRGPPKCRRLSLTCVAASGWWFSPSVGLVPSWHCDACAPSCSTVLWWRASVGGGRLRRCCCQCTVEWHWAAVWVC